MFFWKKKNNFKKVKLNFSGKKKKSNRSRIWIWLIVVFFLFLIPVIIFAGWFHQNILEDIPDLDRLENLDMSETTTITDRNGEVLYELYEERREYVDYDEISENMINAIVAAEDQDFWENPWIDITWIIRAWIHDVTHLWEDLQWASTITQQLIKNILLTPEVTIERKLQEIVLALELSWYLEDQLKRRYQDLSDEELENKIKENVLELYLNYIFLGQNSYWVEAASNTYFWKSASDLNLLESSILASLPVSPSSINPFANQDRLMGSIDVSLEEGQVEDEQNIDYNEVKDKAINEYKELMEEINIEESRGTTRTLNFLSTALETEIVHQEDNYNVSYSPWRKDFVLARMMEDNYINEQEFKEAFLEAFEYEFEEDDTDIKAPHFVFNVIQILEENYNPETLRRWWLEIRTTLDLEKQKIAEESIENNMDHIREHWGNNASMVYVDTETGDVLAYVGSADYDDREIDGNVDIIRSERQPWSALKPLVYALWIQDLWITPDSPIYDVPMQIWNNRPRNADWTFSWLIPIKEALAASRNIPALQMYFALWEGPRIKQYFEDLWFNTFEDDVDYWYPIVIGWWETRMIELATAYSHLTNYWQPSRLNPIEEIKWPDGSIIFRKSPNPQERVLESWPVYLIREILSDPMNMPYTWRENFEFEWIDFWIKTWTSNIRRNGQNLPRDGWVVSYTPSTVAVFWWGNTQWEPLDQWTFGWRLNSPIWRDFFETLEEEWLKSNETMQPRETTNISISEISWNRVTWNIPREFIKNTSAYIWNMPSSSDDSLVESIQYDSLCDWKVSEDYTPSQDIEEGYVIDPENPVDGGIEYSEIVSWREETWIEDYKEETWNSIFLEAPQSICEERQKLEELWEILEINNVNININSDQELEVEYIIESPFKIEEIEISINWVLIHSDTKDDTLVEEEMVYDLSNYPETSEEYFLEVFVEDEFGYQDEAVFDLSDYSW